MSAYEPDHRLAIEGTIGPFHARMAYVMEPTANGTSLTNDVQLEPAGLSGLAGRLAPPRIRTAVARNLDQLKRILEGTSDSAGGR